MLAKVFCRRFSTASSNFAKLVVCGASGGVGQPLSLLLKASPAVSKLTLYDIAHAPGVAADLSHIDTGAEVIAVTEASKLKKALGEADIVVIAAGRPRKPNMTRADLFKPNAEAVKSILDPFAQVKSKALLAIITNPVNSLVPYAAEILKKADCYDPKRLFGVTTLDVIRANTFVARAKGLHPSKIHVPVVGGHSGNTIIPLLSQAEPEVRFNQKELCSMTSKIQNAGSEVVKAKAGRGSATLSMAQAGARFVLSLSKVMRAKEGECLLANEIAYVESDVTEASFFATPLKIGKNGIVNNMGLGKLSCHEQNLIKEALPEILEEIKMGMDFASCEGE